MSVDLAPISDTVNHDAQYDALCNELSSLGKVVVAFSGGADSALLAYAATQVLGRDNVLCVTAISPSLPVAERDECAAIASEWQMRHVFVDTNEMAVDAYVRNDRDRCYFCKDELMDALIPMSEQEGSVIVLGVNLDDLGEHRPGQDAARQKGAKFPFVDAGLTKDAVRAISKAHGLVTWNKPAAACLSSRIPHGTPVTIGILSQVERAEASLHDLGFATLRVRHYGDTARIEVDTQDFGRVLEERVAIIAAVKRSGYQYVTLDLEGFRSGNLSPKMPTDAPLISIRRTATALESASEGSPS